MSEERERITIETVDIGGRVSTIERDIRKVEKKPVKIGKADPRLEDQDIGEEEPKKAKD